MIGRGLFLLTVLSNCVLSLPVTPSQLENEDVEVMKCIVEVLADVLSRPHVTPVSQECLVTLKTDGRLVKILRHHKFLKELQEIAVQGDHERAVLQRDSRTTTPTSQPLLTTDADRSMLEALGGPGERSLLSQQKRTGDGDGREGDEAEGGESREDGRAQGGGGGGGGEGVERRDEEGQGSRASGPAAERRGGEEEEEEEEEEDGESLERRANSDEESEEKRGHSEESEEGTQQGDESDEKRDAHRNAKEKTSQEEEAEDERRAVHAHKHGEEGKRWSKRAKYQSLRKKSAGTEARRLDSRQEVPHHSKEEEEEEEEEQKRDPQRSPEERELQMIAHGAPEERRVLEEEGSAGRKSEEPEIESLAAIESELENVAQKLHELRRG